MSANPVPLYPDADGVLHPHPLGLVECTNEQYHSGPGISKSHLDTIAGKSPRHYWHKYLNPNREPEEPTPAKVLGSAIHAIILEPDLFETGYVPNPGIERRSNAGKAEWAAFVAENTGKVILSEEDYQKCLHIRDAVHLHPVAAGLLTGGKAEQTFYAIDPETGELVKCRTDYLHDSGAMIVDVKTTEDASPAGFGRSSANYRYPMQTAWYHRVLDAAYGEHPPYWVFLAVEKDPPYAIGIYFIDQHTGTFWTDDDGNERPTNRPGVLQLAHEACSRDLTRIVQHKRSGQWPDYGIEALPLQLPTWWKP